jgi:hypothetical protein
MCSFSYRVPWTSEVIRSWTQEVVCGVCSLPLKLGRIRVISGLPSPKLSFRLTGIVSIIFCLLTFICQHCCYSPFTYQPFCLLSVFSFVTFHVLSHLRVSAILCSCSRNVPPLPCRWSGDVPTRRLGLLAAVGSSRCPLAPLIRSWFCLSDNAPRFPYRRHSLMLREDIIAIRSQNYTFLS